MAQLQQPRLQGCFGKALLAQHEQQAANQLALSNKLLDCSVLLQQFRLQRSLSWDERAALQKGLQ